MSSAKKSRREPVLRISAPGKVILFGEHSVVYKRLAIAVSVGLRTTLNLYPTEGEVSLDLPDIGLQRCFTTEQIRSWVGHLIQNDWKTPVSPSREQKKELLDAVRHHISGLSNQHALALASFFYLYCSLCPNLPGVHIEVRSQLPTGTGLGSSAAYGVSLVTALLYRYHQVASSTYDQYKLHTGEEVRPDPEIRELISRWAFTSDQIIHGDASGVDNAICTHGGAITFKAGEIKALEDTQLIQVLLVDTRVPRDTAALVKRVRQRHDDARFSKVVTHLLDAMDELAHSAQVAMTTGDEEALEQLITMNQGLLSSLGVSHPALDSICLVASRHGLPAKLTGGGGGGFALVMLPQGTSKKKIVTVWDELEKLGYGVHSVEVAGDGVLVQNLEL